MCELAKKRNEGSHLSCHLVSINKILADERHGHLITALGAQKAMGEAACALSILESHPEISLTDTCVQIIKYVASGSVHQTDELEPLINEVELSHNCRTTPSVLQKARPLSAQ